MKHYSLILGVATSAVLVACSGDNSPTIDNGALQPPPAPQAPTVNGPQVFTGGLKQTSASAVERFIKNGIYASTFALPVQTFSEAAASGRSGFSTTNTQEQGVDEADRIEYDGSYLYLAQYPQWPVESDSDKTSVRILARQDDFSLQQVNQTSIGDGSTEINGMYLAQDRLSVVHSNYPIMPFAEIFGPVAPGIGEANLSVFNTQAPEQPVKLADIKIDGWLLSSRRIGEYVYLVTGYTPQVEGLSYAEADEATKLKNYQQIQALAMDDLLPKVHVNGQSRLLNQAGDCLVPEQAGQADGARQITTITRVNTLQPTEMTSLCIMGRADAMYMSATNLYLTGSADNQTVLHKVALATDVSYQASGVVKGTLGWQANPQFRMDEEQGYLRIVTSDYQDKPVHQLSVLNQQDRELKLVAQLPNEQQPQAIGKPDEDIYAVRFIGDKGYIVTFERVDPLYVLDLSDATQPNIAGSLEIPGFSSYLHPMENGYLLGVGQDVALEDLPAGDDGSVIRAPVRQGVKVSLFDVRDPANPKELNTIIKEKGFTPVEYDYHALSVLKNDGGYQFAMPLEQWLECDETCIASSFKVQHNLMLLDVNTSSEQASLSETRLLQAKSDQQYFFGGNDRSVIHGQHIYYLHGNQVWHSQWAADAAITGPY